MDLGHCELNKHFPSMKHAGEMVGLDLENPIDCSQMDVYQISSLPEYDSDTPKMHVKRTTVLHAYVFNEFGDREELTITFELISQRMPKVKKD